jgi:O-antigen/teichoic acid export membrane protein
MIEFLLCWIIVLLATISLQIQTFITKKQTENARAKIREVISVFVSSFLVALIFFSVISLVNTYFLHITSLTPTLQK